MLQLPQLPSGILFTALPSDADETESIPLHSEELILADQIKHLGRKEAFLLGRRAARRTVQQLGAGDFVSIGRGSGEEPIWPAGIVGSIAHTEGIAVAIGASSMDFRGIGIDVELGSKQISTALSKRICSPEETVALPLDELGKRERILQTFSAKEAFYKAVYPTIRRFLGFRDVALTWHGEVFTGRILEPRSGEELALAVEGRVYPLDQYLLSLAYIPL